MTAEIPEVPGLTDLSPLGRGGLADVYLARQGHLQRWVAAKVFRVTLADEQAAERFRAECSAIGRLDQYPHVLTVYDAGVLPDGRPYLISERCDGSLSDLVEMRGPLPADRVSALGSTIARALRFAHAAGVLHGDVTPQNLLLRTSGAPVLADFGLAVLRDHAPTAAGFTLLHAAPEALRAGTVIDERADVYGLGSTLYTVLTGEPPFPPEPGEDADSYRRRVRDLPPPHPAGAPDRLAGLLTAMLAPDPSHRPSTDEIVAALETAPGRTTRPSGDGMPMATRPDTDLGHDSIAVPAPAAPVRVERRRWGVVPGARRRAGATPAPTPPAGADGRPISRTVWATRKSGGPQADAGPVRPDPTAGSTGTDEPAVTAAQRSVNPPAPRSGTGTSADSPAPTGQPAPSAAAAPSGAAGHSRAEHPRPERTAVGHSAAAGHSGAGHSGTGHSGSAESSAAAAVPSVAAALASYAARTGTAPPAVPAPSAGPAAPAPTATSAGPAATTALPTSTARGGPATRTAITGPGAPVPRATPPGPITPRPRTGAVDQDTAAVQAVDQDVTAVGRGSERPDVLIDSTPTGRDGSALVTGLRPVPAADGPRTGADPFRAQSPADHRPAFVALSVSPPAVAPPSVAPAPAAVDPPAAVPPAVAPAPTTPADRATSADRATPAAPANPAAPATPAAPAALAAPADRAAGDPAATRVLTAVGHAGAHGTDAPGTAGTDTGSGPVGQDARTDGHVPSTEDTRVLTAWVSGLDDPAADLGPSAEPLRIPGRPRRRRQRRALIAAGSATAVLVTGAGVGAVWRSLDRGSPADPEASTAPGPPNVVAAPGPAAARAVEADLPRARSADAVTGEALAEGAFPGITRPGPPDGAAARGGPTSAPAPRSVAPRPSTPRSAAPRPAAGPPPQRVAPAGQARPPAAPDPAAAPRPGAGTEGRTVTDGGGQARADRDAGDRSGPAASAR